MVGFGVAAGGLAVADVVGLVAGAGAAEKGLKVVQTVTVLTWPGSLLLKGRGNAKAEAANAM